MKVKGYSSKNQGIGATFEDIYIIDGRRTPFGKMKGSMSTVSPTDLAIMSSKAVIKASGVEASMIDQTIAANICAGSADAFFLPRHIALYSGAPVASPAVLAQRICGSGIEVIGQAAEQIGLGKGHLILATGTENMTRMPLVSFGGRMGCDLGKPGFEDMLWEALNDTAAVPMGTTADNLAREYNLNRSEVDALALNSQERYAKAEAEGFFKGEIGGAPAKGVFEAQGLKPRKWKLNGKDPLDRDENPRQTNMEALAKLMPVFSKEGPTTAGNASGIVDGACSVLLASRDFIDTHKIKPLGKIRAYASVGCRPDIMGIGPVPAIQSVLNELKMNIGDIDLFEINEAFAAQCLAVSRALKIDHAKLNIHGGAVAIGHPLAASGLRLVTTVLRSLHKFNKQTGVASACIGGGQGIAMVVERC